QRGRRSQPGEAAAEREVSAVRGERHDQQRQEHPQSNRSGKPDPQGDRQREIGAGHVGHRDHTTYDRSGSPRVSSTLTVGTARATLTAMIAWIREVAPSLAQCELTFLE